jgi:CheY-like chemotaxis protein
MKNDLSKSYCSNNILIVDDHETNQMVMGSILKHYYDINATFANNGREAVFLVLENVYDLIFMDINMPIMDGIEATRIIKCHYPKMPIVALTTNILSESREECFMAGMSEYLTKPLDLLALQKVIQEYLNM